MRDEKLFLEKKEKLEYWINKLGLTKNMFAERVFYHMNNSDNANEIKRFQLKFTKALQRKTTPIEQIESYLDILYELSEFEKLGFIKPKNYFKDEFSDNFNQQMKEISKKISEEIVRDEK